MVTEGVCFRVSSVALVLTAVLGIYSMSGLNVFAGVHKVQFEIRNSCCVSVSGKLGCGAQSVGSLDRRYHLYNSTHFCIFLLWENMLPW